MDELHHVMVVGGTLAEWGALGDDQWTDRIGGLGEFCSDVGAEWLTLRPFERGAGADAARPVHLAVVAVGRCTVIVDPTPDGRERLVVALRKLAEADQLSEPAVAAALLAPATAEPDLVVVLGSTDRLPSSIVWELAYSELVYLDVAWADLTSAHLATAVEAYGHRHRRFGGLD
ncbi:MAG: undecaprenyl diphosphate synthase family protein [Actinobacteria bacterium]|nr:undecaprenyl diphosphate synthase family protein [Actinomycetota bacterium]